MSDEPGDELEHYEPRPYDFSDWNPIGDGEFDKYVCANLRHAFAELKVGRWIGSNDSGSLQWWSNLDMGSDDSLVPHLTPNLFREALAIPAREWHWRDIGTVDEWVREMLQPWRDALCEVERIARATRR